MIHNVRNHPITTITGILVILVGLFLMVFPLIKGLEPYLTSTKLVIVFAFGGGLLVSPDNLFELIKSYISNKL